MSRPKESVPMTPLKKEFHWRSVSVSQERQVCATSVRPFWSVMTVLSFWSVSFSPAAYHHQVYGRDFLTILVLIARRSDTGRRYQATDQGRLRRFSSANTCDGRAPTPRCPRRRRPAPRAPADGASGIP